MSDLNVIDRAINWAESTACNTLLPQPVCDYGVIASGLMGVGAFNIAFSFDYETGRVTSWLGPELLDLSSEIKD